MPNKSNPRVGRSRPACGTIDLADRGGQRLLTVEAAQKEFEPACVYVNTASIGLPPRRVVATLNEAVESWRTGRAEAADYDALVDRARRRFAGLVEVPPARVAIGNQVSTFTGLVAAALPDGACVLAAEEDFTSVLFPFLAHADRGVRVETVPLDRLVERIRPGVSLVAVSAVQSADGRLVPGGLDALASAAAAHGSLTYVCLLYTSPSPRDRQKSRMPSSA